MPRIADLFPDLSDFEQLLSDAESQATTEWEQTFVGDINEKYEQYGAGMYLTEKQREHLEKIVEK
jgi:hypothetical protein